ncbi:hypothetical protein JOD24_001981 [Kroppenstedtia sanguinis]|uniref:Spore germination protein n=1 Tax=Kroppenstedtia sanguinis TaxID=1380684 RepID=A0ABW4C8W0_9BACL
MPAFFNIGLFKNDQVQTGGSVGFGQNIIQNRNSSKFNQGSTSVGDGVSTLPIALHLNADPDLQDQLILETNNIGTGQV